MADVIMPKMGDAMTEGTLLNWLKPDGAPVKAGETIAEIETDKSNVEVEAENEGVLAIQVQVGQTVPVGAVIATIGGSSNGASAPVQAPVEAASSSNGHSSSNGYAPQAAAVISQTPVQLSKPASTTQKYVGETVHVKYSEGIRMALQE